MKTRVDRQTVLYFFFQKKKYIYNADIKQFVKLDYPDHQAIDFYRQASGLNQEMMAKQKQKYGINM